MRIDANPAALFERGVETPGSEAGALRAVARDLETAFISEMLKHSGLGEARSGLGGGGPGEEQFASMLRSEHARLLAERGGIGLAEDIFRTLVARQDAANAPGPDGKITR
jgi:Rod binding domain-containing protein